MDIQDAPRERVEQPRPDDAHEARETHERDPVLTQDREQRGLVGVAVAVRLRIEEGRGHSPALCALQRRRSLAIGHHQHHLGRVVRGGRRLEDRLEVRASTRGEHAHPQSPGGHRQDSKRRSWAVRSGSIPTR